MRVVTLYFLIQIIFCNQIMIDLVTTNDMHGVVKDQKAYFMNPQYPPKIVGGSGLYNYIDNVL